MPTTSNFGWTTPADTDLVKDGALAIRTLGNGIDTSLIDLKGGTTGQILSKASNTDLDYTWITNDVGDITNVAVTAPITGGGSSGSVTIGIDDGTTTQKGAVQLEDSTSSTSTTKAATPNSVKSAYDLANAAIPKSLVDAAGDLIYATADNTVARLALGTAGQVLKVNSGATAPEWAAASAGAIVYLGQGTFSAATSATLDSVFSATYRNYLLYFDYTASAGSEVRVTLRASGVDDTASNYYSELLYGAGATAGAGNSASQTSAKIGGGGTTNGGLVAATIYAPQATAQTRIESRGHKDVGANAEAHIYNAGFTATTSFDGIKLSTPTGNLTGTFRIYGIANS